MLNRLFGRESPGERALREIQESSGGEAPDSNGDKNEKKEKSVDRYRGSGFDPTGLERAAKAARQLDNSRYAREALEAVKTQETTKQLEHKMRIAEYEAYVKQQELRQIEAEAEEARKTLQAQTQHEQQKAQYQDQLERKRYVDEMNARRYMKEEELKKQEELTRRQEEMKRKTLEYEAELRRKTELARVKAETEGKIRQERENHDLHLQQTRLEAAERRETVMEAIQLAGTTMGKGIREFLSDREKMTAGVVTVSAMALGIYTARTGTGVLGRYIEARLGKPTLVRETSRLGLFQAFRNPGMIWKKLTAKNQGIDALQGVILHGNLETKLRRIAKATVNTKRNKAPFRHILLYGPPGTGKTLFAKGLARHSGLDYAIMTGGDVAPLGRDGVTQLHKLFDWSNTSRKGLLLFIDEADAFLRRRATEQISEDLRNALNAFLYRTGEATDKFMLVYASNQPDQFDYAINDRIDEMIEFQLPGEAERERMIRLYLEKYLVSTKDDPKRKTITIKGVEDDHIMEVARATNGFSGREISKLGIAWQSAAYGSENAIFTPELMKDVLKSHVLMRAQKQEWEKEEREIQEKMDAHIESLMKSIKDA